MRLCHRFHALKLEIILWDRLRRMSGAEAFLCMAAVNPGGGESGLIRRKVIVIQTFRRVQDLILSEPCIP